jgi:energy-converting hydrogenase Eha subunit C
MNRIAGFVLILIGVALLGIISLAAVAITYVAALTYIICTIMSWLGYHTTWSTTFTLVSLVFLSVAAVTVRCKPTTTRWQRHGWEHRSASGQPLDQV